MSKGIPWVWGRWAVDKGRADAGEGPSPPGNGCSPGIIAWGSLAAPDQKAAGPPSMPLTAKACQRPPKPPRVLGKQAPHRQAPSCSREKIKRHFPTVHFLLSFSRESPAWMQKPHCCTQGPQSQSLLGASLWQTTTGSPGPDILASGEGLAGFHVLPRSRPPQTWTSHWLPNHGQQGPPSFPNLIYHRSPPQHLCSGPPNSHGACAYLSASHQLLLPLRGGPPPSHGCSLATPGSLPKGQLLRALSDSPG